MRKVILLINVSLDGFIDEPRGEVEPNGETDGSAENEEEWQDLNDLLSTVDTALLGRVTYDIFTHYWPSAATNPSSPKNEIDFAHWIEKTPKLVFSKTLEAVAWNNTRLIKEHIAEEIANLKHEPGSNLLLFGGPGIAQTFMRLGLIDEYRIKINPVILGSGKPLWKDILDRISLRLVKTKTFPSGVVGLYYQKASKEVDN